MANVGFVATSLTSSSSVALLAFLSEFGHTVTSSTQAAFGASTFSAQDVILVGRHTRDDSGFFSDLDNHMDTHGVPIVVLPPDTLASPYSQARNGSGDPDSAASALGVITIERRSGPETAQPPVGTILPHPTEGRDTVITDTMNPEGFDNLIEYIKEADGAYVTEVAEVVEKIDNSVIEVSSNVAGTRLLVDDSGHTLGVAAESGNAKVGLRTGETFSTRIVWLGLGFGETSTRTVGRDTGPLLDLALAWVQDNATINDYPTAGTQRVQLASIDLRPLGLYSSGTIAWTPTTPAGTSITVEVSDDNGATFSSQTNGGSVAVLSASEDVSAKSLTIRITMATSDAAATPTLTGLIVTLVGQNPALQGQNTDGSLTGVKATASHFLNGQVKWITGENADLAMEIREWNPTTNTIKLYLKMPQDIAAGDVFDILPGCQKRILEDCRDRYANQKNHRGEAYVPGTDQMTSYPDAQ